MMLLLSGPAEWLWLAWLPLNWCWIGRSCVNAHTWSTKAFRYNDCCHYETPASSFCLLLRDNHQLAIAACNHSHIDNRESETGGQETLRSLAPAASTEWRTPQ
eukprot:scpid60386/ scgid17820/ 